MSNEESTLDQAHSIALKKSKWPRFDSEDAGRVMAFATIKDVLDGEARIEAYMRAFMANADAEIRIIAIRTIIAVSERLPDLPVAVAFLIFLFLDDDPHVVSTAALSTCVLTVPECDDITTGAAVVIHAIHNREGEICGSLASGIFQTGDLRFLKRLNEAWELIGDDGRGAVAAGGSRKFAYHAQIQFLLDKLEEVDQPVLFGGLAGTLSRLASLADVTGVVDIERVIPVGKDPHNPISILKKWSKKDYEREIAERLRSITRKEIENEDDERIMPYVLQQWDIDA